MSEVATGRAGARSSCRAPLCAKPVIDMLLVVVDAADELAYVAPLEHLGFALRIRERDWHEHRLLKGPGDERNAFAPRRR